MNKFNVQQKNLKPEINSSYSKAFSLLELLIYISILAIIMIASSNIFISMSRSQGQAQARSEVDSAVRFTSELMRQDIKNASSVSVPGLGTPSSSLTLVRGGVTIIYDVSSNSLRRKEGALAPVNITNSSILVSTPIFTRIENTNLTFSDTNITISIDIPFGYNSTSSDWKYNTNLRTSISLY